MVARARSSEAPYRFTFAVDCLFSVSPSAGTLAELQGAQIYEDGTRRVGLRGWAVKALRGLTSTAVLRRPAKHGKARGMSRGHMLLTVSFLLWLAEGSCWRSAWTLPSVAFPS